MDTDVFDVGARHEEAASSDAALIDGHIDDDDVVLPGAVPHHPTRL